jgi:cyanophycinase
LDKPKSMARKENSSCPVPRGILLIVGGKEDKGESQNENQKPESYIPDEILKTFLELLKKKNPTIELVTSGSGMPDETFSDYEKAFKKLADVNLKKLHHVTRSEVLGADLQDQVNDADGFYFSGGDQLKLTSLYGGTPFLTALKNKYIHKPFIIAGTSAGAMALSTPMIYAGNSEVQDIAGSIKITTGLEFLKDVCIDTHFDNRGRFIRLAQVIATNPTSIGIGLGEDTAMIVREGQSIEVLGSGMATVIEGFNITDANLQSFTENMLVSIRNLQVHLISKGDKYTIHIVNPPHI